jgi:hypothetical protein
MERGEEVNAEMNERNEKGAEDPEHRRVSRAKCWRLDRPSEDDVRHVDEPEKKR